jgi:hypothetical protein
MAAFKGSFCKMDGFEAPAIHWTDPDRIAFDHRARALTVADDDGGRTGLRLRGTPPPASSCLPYGSAPALLTKALCTMALSPVTTPVLRS